MSFSQRIFIMVLFIQTLLYGSSNSPFDKRTPFKEATITYSLSGSTTGSSTLYVKDYGKYLAEHEKSSMSMFGFSKAEEKLTITTPDWVYTIDLIEKSGSKVTNMEKYLKEEYEKLSASDKKKVQRNAKRLGTNMTQEMGGDVKFNAAMLHGYSCDKTSVMGMSSYTIHETAILLKMEGTMMGAKMLKEATSLKMGSVSKSHFEVPKGITVTHDARGDAMMKEQAKQIIAMLVNPDKAPSRSSSSQPAAQPEENRPSQSDMDEAQKAVGDLFKSLF